MSDNYRMDSHKLIFHPDRVAKWMAGENIYPICIEISPSGTCNHRCIFCGLDYLGYKANFLDKELILKNLKVMAEKGLKSMVVCGEGEPLLNRQTPEIINGAKSYGIDVSLVTNGVLLTEEVSRECLGSLTWIRFSINGGSEETHQLVHGGKPGDFKKVLANVESAVRIKKENALNTTIGVQLVLLNENAKDVISFANILKDIGVDYFSIKPFSQHPRSGNRIGSELDYNYFLDLENKLRAIESREYKIIFRAASMIKKSKPKCYKNCYGIPFWAYIDANAEIWACIAYIGQEGYSYGNLKDKDFSEIWESENKRSIIERIASMDITNCRELCRLDSINEYLYELKNPVGHVNFI